MKVKSELLREERAELIRTILVPHTMLTERGNGKKACDDALAAKRALTPGENARIKSQVERIEASTPSWPRCGRAASW